MKAYVTNWYRHGYRIGPVNMGGSKEVDIPAEDYLSLMEQQEAYETFQSRLHEIHKTGRV